MGNHRIRPVLLTSTARALILILVFIVPSINWASAQGTPFCPLSQGYWANNAESWPVPGVMLGAQFYQQAELLSFMPGGGGDASTMLAVQLTAAKLNIAAGADPAPISTALLQADAALSQFAGKLPYNIEVSSAEGQVIVNIAATLDAYNNGQLTPNCAQTPTATLTNTAPPTSGAATLTPTAQPTLAACPPGMLLNSFTVAYTGRAYDPATNQTTFTYVVCGTGVQPDLSHFTIEIPICAPPLIVAGTSPSEAVRFGLDPTTGVNGIKWDLPLQTTSSRTYALSFLGNVAEGSVQAAVKGDSFQAGTVPGASCAVLSLAVDKSISTDQVNWLDATDLPGPQIDVGAGVFYRFVVRNIGNAELASLTLTDSAFDTGACTIPTSLPAGGSFECILGPFPAVEGQHTNTVTASGSAAGQTTTASDTAYHFSGNVPIIRLEKLASSDGNFWSDNTEVAAGGSVSYRFVITNIGNTRLEGLTLSDPSFDISTCALPAALEPTVAFECTIGPFPATQSSFNNTATVSATFAGQTVSDTDSARYTLSDDDDDDDTPIIIIEGPVQAINVNVITIFDLDIEVDPNDSILTLIRIGDNVRVEGEVMGQGDTLIIVAITVINVDVDLVFVGQPVGVPGNPFYIPPGCRITGFGNNNPRLKCSNVDDSGRSGRSSRRS